MYYKCMNMNKFSSIYLTGKVCYSNGEYVKNALIIVEKIVNYKTTNYIGFTHTNLRGDFIIEVKDRSKPYKLTAIDCSLKNKFNII